MQIWSRGVQKSERKKLSNSTVWSEVRPASRRWLTRFTSFYTAIISLNNNHIELYYCHTDLRLIDNDECPGVGIRAWYLSATEYDNNNNICAVNDIILNRILNYRD